MLLLKQNLVFFDSNTLFDFEEQRIGSGFIITGSQTALVNAIEQLTLIPSAPDNYTITITSTDSQGATDIDSFDVNVTGTPLNPNGGG